MRWTAVRRRRRSWWFTSPPRRRLRTPRLIRSTSRRTSSTNNADYFSLAGPFARARFLWAVGVNALFEKVALLKERAAADLAGPLEYVALASYALHGGDVEQSWRWAAKGFELDPLSPEAEALLLQVARLV